MKELKIVGVNLDIVWGEKENNFRKIEAAFEHEDADLFFLPEMFSTGFNMKPKEIADQENISLKWMRQFAMNKNRAICGSISVVEDKLFYNRFYFVKPDGTYIYYDKRHLFSYAGENKTYTAGTEKIIIEYQGWRILLQVCYDLRFPVFSRNTGDYDAILYAANWPESRIDAWNTLLKARAIENQCYVFGLNRIGTDGNGIKYPESSYCFFADGSIISIVKDNIVTAKLDLHKLSEFREKFQFLNDADSFEIK